jgi:tRNA(Ile)-lysidine synthase
MEALHLVVARFLREQRVSRSEPLLAAVSGGADSLALLEVLVQIGQRVGAAHVHHELRGADADADLAFVTQRAAQLGVPLHALRVSELTLRPPRRTSPEARARALRYAALEQLRASSDYRHVLTAHTLDDQAETLLLRALRGTDLMGLAGIAPRLDARHLLRPLLGVRRAELRDYLRRRALGWREDASNADRRVPRNLLRADVLPLLEQVHPGGVAHLAALAGAARAWREPVEQADAERLSAACREGEGGLWISPSALEPRAPGEGPRLLAALLRRAGLGERVTRLHLARVEGFLRAARTGQALSLPARHVLVRTPERFWLGPAPGPGAEFAHELAPGGLLELPGCGLRLSVERGRSSGRGSIELPLEAAPDRLIVRSPHSLDVLAGPGGAQLRLAEWLAAARWPRAVQKRLAVVEKEGRIVGVMGASVHAIRAWPSVGSDTGRAALRWWIRGERLSRVPAS